MKQIHLFQLGSVELLTLKRQLCNFLDTVYKQIKEAILLKYLPILHKRGKYIPQNLAQMGNRWHLDLLINKYVTLFITMF